MRLGELPTRGLAGQQDAFHVPAVMAIVEHDMWPGACVRFTDDTMTRVTPCNAGEREGVIDPLLKGSIPEGTLVWVCLDNNLVPGTLSHQFAIVRRPTRACVEPPPVAVVGIPVEELTDLPTQPAVEVVPEEPPAEPVVDGPPTYDPLDDDWDNDGDDCNARPPCV